MKVIIYTNSNNAVSVCVPTGEIPIEAVLAKDCPQGAIIVDDSVLPQADNDFFDAWELNNGTVSVNLDKAKTIATNNLNVMAKAEVNHRATNTGIGIDNKLSDADWLTALNTARTAISSATSTQNLRDAVKPINDAIEANK
jgi:hypothetical protein